jgi:DNA-binding NarL/FixJ family response regulator
MIATESPSTVRVLVLGGCPAVLVGLRSMLDGLDGVIIVDEVVTPFVNGALGSESADVMLVDLLDRDDASVKALDRLPYKLPIVFIGTDSTFFRDLDHDAPGRGYLLRDADTSTIAAALRAAARGLVVMDQNVAAATVRGDRRRPRDEPQAPELSEREQEVLRLLVHGLPNKVIAQRLNISQSTVRFHVGAILGKLGASNRTEAVAVAVRLGIVPI